MKYLIYPVLLGLSLMGAATAAVVEEPVTAEPAMQMQPVNINTATVAELQLLKGIGEAKAKAIVEYREANGAFTTLEDLTKVKGIGPKVLESNRHMLSL